MDGALAGLVRRRELFCVLLLVAVAAQLVLGVVGFAVDYWPGIEPVMLVAALAVAIWCAAGTPTPHARTLLVLAMAGAAAGTLLDLVRAVSEGLDSRFAPTVMLFLDVAFSQAASLVGIAAAVVALSGLSARTPAPYGQPAPPVALPPYAPTPPAPLEQRPTWQPDHASGAAWTTAGDAAAGAPGTSWDTSSGAGSWQPIPGGAAPTPRSEPLRDPAESDGPAPRRADGPDWSAR